MTFTDKKECIPDWFREFRTAMPVYELCITKRMEAVINKKHNVYIPLAGVDSRHALCIEILHWLSRPACKGVPGKVQGEILLGINKFLGTSFTSDDMQDIYTRLGNGVNRELCEKFIDSGFDMNLIREGL